MSLSEKNEKYRQDHITKTVTITATPDDMKALEHVMKEIDRMFSPDLFKDGDLPPRITISEKVDPEAVMYPRAATMIRRMGQAFRAGAGGNKNPPAVSVAEIPIFQEAGTRGNQIVGLLDTILSGSTINKGKVRGKTNYMNVIAELDGMIQNPELRDVLAKSNLEWAYAQNLDTHMGAYMSKREKKSFKKMLKADAFKKDYPMDAGDYSQAYIAMLRSDDAIPLDSPTRISKKDWEHFKRNYGISGIEVHQRYDRPPRNMGELMEFVMAYSMRQALRFDNAVTVPFAQHRTPIEGEVILGSGENNEVKGFKHLYKGVVLGTGPLRLSPAAISGARGSLSKIKVDEFPGF
jgi:hypothetical protein